MDIFSRGEVKELQSKNQSLKDLLTRRDVEIEFLKKDFKIRNEAQMKKDKSFIGDLEDYLDPLPAEVEARKAVVSKISGWFEGELSSQMKHMISRMEHEIARFPLTERETDFHRAGINFGHLLLDWGESIVGEHKANIHDSNEDGEPESAFDSEEDEAVTNIKEAIK